MVKSIVDSEGPIHIDLVKERVAQASSIKRIGNRVVSSIMRGIGQGINANLFIQRGEFLWPRTKKVPLIRVPKNGDERRTIDQICPEEIALAVDLCLRSALSLTSDDLIRETARLFKLNASENNSNVIHHIIGRMEQKLMVEFREDRYYPSSEYDQPIPVFKIENWLDY